MGFFSKLFKGPEIDMEKSRKNAEKMRLLFNQEVENGDTYRLIFGYTEDVSRFNYGFVHGSRTKIGNLIVGWNEDSQTIAVVPTVPDLSGCGTPVFYRRSEILKAYRNKYPTDAFIIYPDKKGYIGINAYDWLEDEKLYVYVEQAEELARQGFLMLDQGYVRPLKLTPAFLADLDAHDLFQLYRSGEERVCMIHGDEDQTASPEAARRFAQTFGARLIQVPGGDHSLSGPGMPQLVVREALEFYLAP